MRRVLITRPIDDAAPLVAALKARGVEAMVEPMMTIRSTEEPLPELNGAQGVLFTSANGVRGFMTRTDRRDLKAYAVGEATAEAARRAGFAEVDVAGGDANALATLVIETCKPDAGKLIHVAGTHVAGNLSEQLTKAGFTVERAVLYDALSAHRFSMGTVESLRRAELEAVMLFSPRTAEIFMTLVDESGAEQGLSELAAVCLSEAVADRLPSERFRTVVVAAKPDQPAMLDALDRAMSGEALVAFGVAPPPPNAAKGVGLGALVFTGFLSVATTLALLTLTIDQWKPMFFPVAANDSEAAIGALNRRVTALEAQKPATTAAAVPADLLERIAKLERQASAPSLSASSAPVSTPVDLGPLEGRIAALEARPVATPFDATSILDQLSRVADRVGRSEQKVTEGESRLSAAEAASGKRVMLALGLAQIADLARAGLPFQAQLGQVVQAGDAAVAAAAQSLDGLAQRGAPTIEQLRARFPEIAKRALNASFALESGDFIGELRAALARAITIRRLDALSSDAVDPESRLAKAEALLAIGDLAGALAQLEGLPTQALAAIGDWVGPAKDRLALDAALKELSAMILRLRSGS
jgi:uroporphyrinogen-III synthase